MGASVNSLVTTQHTGLEFVASQFQPEIPMLDVSEHPNLYA